MSRLFRSKMLDLLRHIFWVCVKYELKVLGRVEETIRESIKCQCKNSVLTVFRIFLCGVWRPVISSNGWHLRWLTTF